MNHPKHTINALINLLEDEDRHVSTLAMEQLLHQEQTIDQLVAEFQESHNPILRSRIHQLSNILKMRRCRNLFVESVRHSSISLLEGAIKINYLYNPVMNMTETRKAFRDLARKLPSDLSSSRLGEFLREENFIHTTEDMLGADLYLIEDVLLQRVGSSLLLSLIANELSRSAGIHNQIVIYRGKHSLLDDSNNLIDPSENWRISRAKQNDRLHPCTKNDIFLTILSQLFLSAIFEGRLQSIYRVCLPLTDLCGGKLGDLPFPLGS